MNNPEREIVSFLDSNLPCVDTETKQVYELLEEENSDVLFPKNLDIPKEKLKYYASKHLELYSEKAQEICNELPPSLVLSSGMFGGKTTFSFLILENLLKQGQNVEVLIADVMNEDCVTARSFQQKNACEAKRFGHLSDYEKTIEELSQNGVDCIFLDEFSFLDVKVVEDLQEMCLVEKKNLVLTGLNANYLGQPLPAFYEGSKIISNSKVERCYSFIMDRCEEKPEGTHTIRYCKIGGEWILDVGLLPLVVSKERTDIIKYTPGVYDDTAIYLLKDEPKLLESVLNPSFEKVKKQESNLISLT